MTDPKQLAKYQRTGRLLNQSPLNRAALKLLPNDWSNPAELHVLSLTRWAVQEGGLDPNYKPGPESLLAMLGKLDRDDPRDALEFLTTSDSGDQVVSAENLKGLNLQEAGQFLVQALADKMLATAP